MSKLGTPQIINLAHILPTGPLILFIAVNKFIKRPISSNFYVALLVLAIIAVLYHLYLLYQGAKGPYGRYINVLHLLIGSLLLFVTISYLNKKSINPFYYTLMFLLAAGAISYHLYLLTVGKK